GRADPARDAAVALHAVARLEPLVALLGLVGRGLLADPEPDAEGLGAPATVALLRGLAADHLARADQRGGALELLEREQAQRVAHEHGDAVLARPAPDRALQSPEAQGVRGE